MTPLSTADLNEALAALKAVRREFAPEYNAGRLYGATGPSITRARVRYMRLTGVIERMTACRDELRSGRAKQTGGYAPVTGGQETSK